MGVLGRTPGQCRGRHGQGIVSGTRRARHVRDDIGQVVSSVGPANHDGRSSRSTAPLIAERVMASKARTVDRISAVVTG